MKKTGMFTAVILTAALLGTLLAGLDRTLAQAQNALRPSLRVLVFMQNTWPDSQANEWGKKLRDQNPDIQNISFISRDQAYQEAVKEISVARALVLLRENP